MTDETDTVSEVARTRAVTEFHVTYFGLAQLEHDALLDLYADHAYKFAERHGHETPCIGSRSWPTVEAWEADESGDAQIATHAPAEQPQPASGGNRTGGGLGERLRALGTGQTRSLRKELREIADEVDEVKAAYRVADAEIARLREFHDHYRAQVERVRALADEYARGRGGPTARRIREALDGPTNETEETNRG